jgi:hypothetical protein
MLMCKRCRAPIYWDSSRRTDNGKWIPIDKETGESHDCPESDYNSGGSGNRGRGEVNVMEITDLKDEVAKNNKNVRQLIIEVRTMVKRIEGQMPLTFGISASEPNPGLNIDPNLSSNSVNHLGDEDTDLSSS